MYSYSKDISIKENPEDFVYYVPKGITYTTTYIDYTINKNYQVVSEGKPHEGIFFYKYYDGAGGAYCTFMGGKTPRVQRTPKTLCAPIHLTVPMPLLLPSCQKNEEQ